MMRREKEKLERTLGGIRDMGKTPSAIWIVDTNKEHLAVAEAAKLNIPVIAILDTNCDPDDVDYGIPGNDDAIRSIDILTRVVADAIAEGLVARGGGGTDTEDPMPEWEREILAGEEGEEKAEEPKADEAEATEAPAEEAPAEEAAAEEPAAEEASADEAEGTEEKTEEDNA